MEITSSQLRPLGDVAQIIRGITFELPDKVDPKSPDAVICMTTRNIQHELEDQDVIGVPAELVKRKEQFLQAEDILVSSANSWDLVGKCVRIPRLKYRATAGGFISILRPNETLIDPGYLYRWLSSGPTQHKIRYCARQTTNIANLSFEQVLALRVPVPSLPNQRHIAAILDKADAIRRKRQEAAGAWGELLYSAFLELFGEPFSNSKKWGERRLGEISDIQSGVTKGRDLKGKTSVFVPYMRVANVQDGRILLDDVKQIEVLPSDVERLKLAPGDVLLTEGGDPDKLGRGAVWRGEINPCIHQNHIFRVRPHLKIVLPDYLSMLIGSARGKKYFLRAAKQTTGIATINRTQLDAFPVPLPPMDLQEKFAKLVKVKALIDSRVTELEESGERLFAALVQGAFRAEL